MTLKLKADPTFTAKVEIPVPGKEPVPISFTFSHRTKAELDAFLGGLKDRKDKDVVMDMVTGWEIEEEFNPANVATLLDNYGGVARAIFQTYIHELQKSK